MNISFAVIIPMFNEAIGAENSANQIITILNEIDCPTAIIFVNDGSTDETESILKKIVTSHKGTYLISHTFNKGYGAALKTGSIFASKQGFEYLVYMDSDLTNDPKDLVSFYNKMLQDFDYVKATRYSDGGGVEGVPFKRRLVSKVGNKIARFLFDCPLTDPTNGFRAIRTKIAVSLNLIEDGFPLIMEELYHIKKITIKFANIPVILRNRDVLLRDSSFSYTPKQIYKYFKYPVLSFITNLWSSK